MGEEEDQNQRNLLVLFSNSSLQRQQMVNYQRAVTLLNAKKIPFQTLDGSDPSCRERRNELFSISGLRGLYPQFFLIDETKKTTTFLGDWDTIEALNDASGLPEEVLDANPAIMTWEKVLGSISTRSS